MVLGLVASIVRQKCKAGHLAGGWSPLWLVDGGRFGCWMEAALKMSTREEMKKGTDVPD